MLNVDEALPSISPTAIVQLVKILNSMVYLDTILHTYTL